MKQRFYVRFLTLFSFLLLTGSAVLAQLQPATMRQIQSLLAEKESRTAVQRKISSQLLQASREARGQKMAADVDLEAAPVKADKRGIVQVDITARVTAELINKIRSGGGKIIYASAQFNSIRAELNVSNVETIAAYKEVKFVKPAARAKTVGSGFAGTGGKPSGGVPAVNKTGVRTLSFAERARRVSDAVENYMRSAKNFSAPPAGLTTAQGDRTHRSDEVRARYGYAGQGIRIGVLSDSYNALGAAAADVATGELPGTTNPIGNNLPVTVLEDYPGGGDEGRAMLQIVHDMAPKAQLFFATAFVSEAGFADNILALRSAPNNCDIIIDDIAYADEPAFQDGIIAQAVNTVTASGALYFSSAGNQGSLAKNTSGVWEGDFNNAGSPVFTGGTKTGTIHNFGTLSAPVNGNIIKAGSPFVYTLNWADPMGASGNDYDLFIVSAAGVIKAASTDVQDGSQDPLELISPPAFTAGDRLVVFKAASAQVRAFSVNTWGGLLTAATNGQILGHAAAADAYGVAATPAQTPFSAPTPAGPFPAAFTSTNQVEAFSSDGPRRIFFNADGTAVTPNNFLFGTNGGNVRRKPDITAADGVATTLPSGSGLNPFYGTSAAAPHAGAVAALIKSAKPSLTPAQIRTILTSTALNIESPGFDDVSGFGIVQAAQAIEAVKPAPLASLALGFVTATEGSFNNGNGSIEPGELGNLTVELRNFSSVGATNAVATLSTNTPGVTILRSVNSYGNIAAESNLTNTAAPFTFAVNKSVACGSTINFTITTAFNGGAGAQGFQFTIVAGSRLGATISSVLGSPATSNGYASFTGTQTGRLNRNGAGAVCGVTDVPLLNTTVGARAFDAYTFTNTSSSALCITSTLTSVNGIDLYQTAYNDSGYAPATPLVHYLAGAGLSGTPTSFEFTVAAGKKFTVVVHAVTPGAQVGTAYSLGINFNLCSAGPACNPAVITNTTIPNGATGSPYAFSFAATGGSGSGTFGYQLRGNLPAGLSFTGNTLSGTPTQAGSFAISVIASEPAGCTPDTNTYTLVIAGNPPASVAATYGTPQQAYPTTTFTQVLQATVKDAGGNPLPGVKVVFTAPTSGASGLFASRLPTDTAITNSNGVAISAAFTASAITGSYVVTASVNGVPSANFNLTNYCPSSFIVTSGADSGPGSLRSLLGYACPGVTITFDQSVKLIQLTSGELPVSRAVSIVGPGAGKLTISGNNNSRIFNIAAGALNTVNISGLTITNGLPNATSFLGGGGVLVNTGTVNLTDCVISACDASLTYFGEGGAIDNEGGTLIVNRCAIINNSAYADGGGITQYAGTLTISNSTVAGNSVSALGDGGGIFVNSASTMTNNTVYGNRAQSGGNIYRYAGIITFRNNIIGGGTLVGTGGTGPDINGAGFTSADYNLIENVTAGTITGVTTHNITGVRANLLPLTNYGGETPVLLPRSNSRVINNGDSALLAGLDQRGLSRFIGRRADIGAVETNYAVAATSGTPQSALVNTPFAQLLQARITETGIPVAGDSLFFMAPAIGASGTFTGPSLFAVGVSNVTGLVTSPVFTANGLPGRYNVTGSLGMEFPPVLFDLTNTAGSAAAGALEANSAHAVETGVITTYPNPVRDQLIVQTGGGKAKQMLTVTDVLGRYMVKLNVSGGRHEINTRDWAKGLYIVTVIEAGKTIHTAKIVKE